jgi:hypothetical protein
VVVINKRELIITNTSAELAFILPFGISRISEVLGFAVSISLSIYLLKAIAAERAKTIQRNTKTKIFQLISLFEAKKKPIKANGIAKMV